MGRGKKEAGGTLFLPGEVARSRDEYTGASFQTVARWRRCGSTPMAVASFVCMSTQKPHPLSCDARSFTSSSSSGSSELACTASSSLLIAWIAAG